MRSLIHSANRLKASTPSPITTGYGLAAGQLLHDLGQPAYEIAGPSVDAENGG